MTVVSPPRLLQPGLIPYVPGVERHRARDGGACVIALATGDQVTLVDREGRQRCEIAGLGADLGALGLDGSEPASPLRDEAAAAALRLIWAANGWVQSTIAHTACSAR